MNDGYLVEQLVKKGRKLRKAQKEYYSCKADPRTDPIKKAYLKEAQWREDEFDRLLAQVDKVHPVPEES